MKVLKVITASELTSISNKLQVSLTFTFEDRNRFCRSSNMDNVKINCH